MSTTKIEVTDSPQIRKNIWDILVDQDELPSYEKLPNELTVEEFAEMYSISKNLAQQRLLRWFKAGKVTRRMMIVGRQHVFVYLPKENMEA